ncbi:MAG: multiheme c-type cytochrome [Gemmatimonadaceae bacterium]
MTGRRLAGLVAATLVVLVALAAGVMVVAARRDRWPVPVRAANAVGDSTCLSCHAGMASYEKTAHRLTTRHPSAAALEGHFESGANVLRTTNPYLHFVMHADSTGFYETAVSGKAPDTTMRTERIAYVAGSGRKGQSYLYWSGDRLYQLPISYWRSLDSWINSPGPGYVDGEANFDRAIAPRCFECHATWIQQRPSVSAANEYDSTGAILGVTCERCHASGAEHVARERSAMRSVRPPAIVNPARLDRQQQMDACAQCHGGLGSPKVPSFSYVAGKRLDDYLYRPPLDSSAIVDVHGNQAALLARSRCFQRSQMTCLTCHDVHREERNIAVLSGKCLTCHELGSASLPATHGKELVGRCVSCHMPLQKSNLIVSALGKEQEHVEVRSHWIKVYRDSLTH